MTSNEIEAKINQNTNQQMAYQKQIDELKAKLSDTKKECRTLRTQYNRAIKSEQQAAAKIKPYCDLLLDAMIIGAKFTVKHGSIAPYSHGYFVTSEYIKEGFCRTISTYKGAWHEQLPKMTYDYLINQGWTDKEFKQLQKEVDAAWRAFPTNYNPDKYTPDEHKYLHGNHIANGYETDGFANIIKGNCGGTYSSWTTSSQNDLSVQLIILKGFGFDYYAKHQNIMPKELLIDVYSRHNLDFDFDDIESWCKNNPTRCMPNSKYFVSR